jgi:hypothetical protein
MWPSSPSFAMAPITAPAGARCNQNQTCRHRVHDATSGLEKKDASACSVRLPQDHVLTITRRTGLLSHAVISPCRIQYPVVCLPATIGASKPDHRWSGTLRISIEPFFQGKSDNYKVRQAFDPAIDCFLQASSVIFISSFPLTGSQLPSALDCSNIETAICYSDTCQHAHLFHHSSRLRGFQAPAPCHRLLATSTPEFSARYQGPL